MRIIGIDPGLTRCGVGVIESQSRAAQFPQLVAVGVVRTAAGMETAKRLVLLERELEEWFEEYQPDLASIEQVYAQHNLHSVIATAQAAGVAALVAARRGLSVGWHTPSEVKAAVTGQGRSAKEQVGAMVAQILKLQAPPKPADAADALAVAICHAYRGTATNRYAALAAAAGGKR